MSIPRTSPWPSSNPRPTRRRTRIRGFAAVGVGAIAALSTLAAPAGASGIGLGFVKQGPVPVIDPGAAGTLNVQTTTISDVAVYALTVVAPAGTTFTGNGTWQANIVNGNILAPCNLVSSTEIRCVSVSAISLTPATFTAPIRVDPSVPRGSVLNGEARFGSVPLNLILNDSTGLQVIVPDSGDMAVVAPPVLAAVLIAGIGGAGATVLARRREAAS